MRVLNVGTYDLLHPGHLSVFRQMRHLAGPTGTVIVGVNTDDFVERFKGHAPVQTFEERCTMLRAIREIDYVLGNHGAEDATIIVTACRPDIIAVGRDWWSPDDSKYCAQMGFTREWLEDRSIQLRYLDWADGYSSTNIRAVARSMTA